MLTFETTDENGELWNVGIQTDVERFWFGSAVVPMDCEVFDHDSELRWSDRTYAWQVESDTGHEIVNHRTLHWEPPTDDELEQARERRRKWERKLASRY